MFLCEFMHAVNCGTVCFVITFCQGGRNLFRFYYRLRVLGRTIINCAATCVIPWIIFFGLYVLK